VKSKPTKLDLDRMQALVRFTRGSFKTSFPSPFGSSIYEIESGELISNAYDTVMQESDPTNHAEVNAIRIATRKLGRLSLRGCVLYSTCEPCPMCTSALIWAELEGVIYGASTKEDADLYWPQASDISPDELIAHMQFEPKIYMVKHVERPLCQELFRECDQVRKATNLKLPPHRDT